MDQFIDSCHVQCLHGYISKDTLQVDVLCITDPTGGSQQLTYYRHLLLHIQWIMQPEHAMDCSRTYCSHILHQHDIRTLNYCVKYTLIPNAHFSWSHHIKKSSLQILQRQPVFCQPVFCQPVFCEV